MQPLAVSQMRAHVQLLHNMNMLSNGMYVRHVDLGVASMHAHFSSLCAGLPGQETWNELTMFM